MTLTPLIAESGEYLLAGVLTAVAAGLVTIVMVVFSRSRRGSGS